MWIESLIVCSTVDWDWEWWEWEWEAWRETKPPLPPKLDTGRVLTELCSLGDKACIITTNNCIITNNNNNRSRWMPSFIHSFNNNNTHAYLTYVLLTAFPLTRICVLLSYTDTPAQYWAQYILTNLRIIILSELLLLLLSLSLLILLSLFFLFFLLLAFILAFILVFCYLLAWLLIY